MTFVLGRDGDLEAGLSGHLGYYRALDGSRGAMLHVDLDGPHAVLIVGKRGYGKSFTLGVVAEELSRAPGVSPVVIDPMGVFATLAESAGETTVSASVLESPAVTPTSLDPRSWCELLGLSPESGAGGLVWRAAQEAATIEGMCTHVDASDAPGTDRRAAINHLELARSWGVFDDAGVSADDLAGGDVTIVDVSGLDSAPMNAVCRAIAEDLYRARVTGRVQRLPWLLLDEAHTFFTGVADPALRRILTRGRAPGVSLVLATQRPSAVPSVAISQTDLLLSHRLTSRADLEALERAQPTYLRSSLDERMPTAPGEVLVVDDATETVHAGRIRNRETPHGGDSPSASAVSITDERADRH
ncbi:ATP-binding protein [Natrarchaeobius halalkaliphilus]|uniref:ATP-binding protein n=1 Tax=Natrarchaeobius halalkaliphilus TaxID=1679091 RepID=A0A3N6LTE2_9EURY|nr:DUF87 domain-containing protein [Natrarchaeobius halalkaliphilus]RQG93313.1 ATP-binding protein [Natrarchaeobius halalkaliphilus]